MSDFAKRIGLIFSLIIALLGVSAPVQAAPYLGCNDSSVCLTQARNFQQNMWQSSLNNVHLHTSGGVSSCLNLAPATWANGTPVTDNSGSVIVNNRTDAAWTQYNVYLFNWVNCNPGGGYDFYTGGSLMSVPYLDQHFFIGAPSISEYHAFTSVGLIPKA